VLKWLKCGDTALREAGSYLAEGMAHFSITFDYLASNQRFNDEFLFRAYRGIILSDYPAINFTPGQLVKLTEKVPQGMGFLMIGGWASFTGANREYTETVIREVLPVIILCLSCFDRHQALDF
jgi:Putative glutamine amidotransferase